MGLLKSYLFSLTGFSNKLKSNVLEISINYLQVMVLQSNFLICFIYVTLQQRKRKYDMLQAGFKPAFLT